MTQSTLDRLARLMRATNFTDMDIATISAALLIASSYCDDTLIRGDYGRKVCDSLREYRDDFSGRI